MESGVRGSNLSLQKASLFNFHCVIGQQNRLHGPPMTKPVCIRISSMSMTIMPMVMVMVMVMVVIAFCIIKHHLNVLWYWLFLRLPSGLW